MHFDRKIGFKQNGNYRFTLICLNLNLILKVNKYFKWGYSDAMAHIIYKTGGVYATILYNLIMALVWF